MAKTIYTYLHNDDLSSSRIVSMDNCFCKLYNIQRGDNEFLQAFKDDLQKPALYILLNKKEVKAYIGESDTFFSRLQSHMACKDFWLEALAFTASDDSLSKTEVQYLEHLAYDKASKMNTYDLRENTQVPKAPHMTLIQKSKTEEFFKYVQFLTKFVGCDIFEQKPSVVLRTTIGTSEEPLVRPIEIPFVEGQLGGRIKLSFNGEGAYPKRFFVMPVVKEVMKTFPDATFAQLQATFPVSLLGVRWGGWGMLQDNLAYAEQNSDRFNPEILTSSDGVRFRVCNQWDQHNILSILGIVKAMGWKWDVIK